MLWRQEHPGLTVTSEGGPNDGCGTDAERPLGGAEGSGDHLRDRPVEGDPTGIGRAPHDELEVSAGLRLPEQHVERLNVYNSASWWASEELLLSALDPVELSKLVRDLEGLRSGR